MYKKGDLLWIPAGVLLTRPRILGVDNLFSNYYQTTSPSVALFLSFDHDERNKCTVMLGGQNWSVELKNIRHSVQEESYVN